jgi:undecaprenyl-phosphate galactose phosphotransferase
VYRDIKIIDGGDDYVDYARTHSHKFFVIALDGFRGKVRDNMMDTMRRYGIDHVIVPPIRRVSLYGMEPQYFFGHDVMFLRHRPTVSSPMGRILKRLFDIFGATCGLLLLGVPLLYVVFKVRKDGGGAFYGGKRIGRDGAPFSCWKFRSMCVDSEQMLEKLFAENEEALIEFETTYKLKNDPRVTRIGSVMRRTSIDELPQLWNVLKGEMSLVGPRPVPQNELDTYTAEGYRAYKVVKPGITGLWQVSGRSDTSYEQRIRYDIWYVRNWSLWHDVVIIVKTIKVVLFGSGAY